MRGSVLIYPSPENPSNKNLKFKKVRLNSKKESLNPKFQKTKPNSKKESQKQRKNSQKMKRRSNLPTEIQKFVQKEILKLRARRKKGSLRARELEGSEVVHLRAVTLGLT